MFAVSSMGTVGAATPGNRGGSGGDIHPTVWWIGFAPVVFVFIAYRAYVAQTSDKARVAALFDAATALHRNHK